MTKLPLHEPDRPFEAPWQAQLFALTVAMNEAGAFEWARWADAFGASLEDVAEELPTNEGYWRAWLNAFGEFLVSEGVSSQSEVEELTQAWHRAAHATPHGEPIVLQAGS